LSKIGEVGSTWAQHGLEMGQNADKNKSKLENLSKLRARIRQNSKNPVSFLKIQQKVEKM
jgi:hypothetical protein